MFYSFAMMTRHVRTIRKGSVYSRADNTIDCLGGNFLENILNLSCAELSSSTGLDYPIRFLEDNS